MHACREEEEEYVPLKKRKEMEDVKLRRLMGVSIQLCMHLAAVCALSRCVLVVVRDETRA